MTIIYSIGGLVYFFMGIGLFSLFFISEWYDKYISGYTWKRICLFLLCITLWFLFLFCIGIFSFICLIISLNIKDDKEKQDKKELKRKMNELNNAYKKKCYYKYEFGIDYNLCNECRKCEGSILCMKQMKKDIEVK